MPFVLPGLGLALLAAPLAAQERPSMAATDKEIVVTGERREVDRTEVTRQARAVSRDTDVRHSPLARFEGVVCPGVIGLQRDFAEPIVARLRMVADDLEIPLGTENECTPNILVVFTEDGRADLEAIQRKTALLSRELPPNERRELLEEPGPVRVFTVVETRMQNGTLVPKAEHLAQTVAEIPVGRMEGGQSRISTGIRREIASVLVLFDREAVKGKTLRQLADYAAMRVFARTRNAEGEAAPDSILGLFEEGNATPALGMTEFDQAYLAALYEGSAHLRGLGKLMRVGRKLEKLRESDQ